MDAYHHGDLRQALIDATAALLAERGPEGFSLREVARRAGVSPAAPAHHFGDAGGLLTAVATAGFDELTQALRLGDARGGAHARDRVLEQGIEYVRFAMRHPGRFRLMFSNALLHPDEALEASGNAAFRMLADAVRDAFGIVAPAPLSPQAWSALLALWSAVHGFAHLAIAGRLDPCTGGMKRERFVEEVLPSVLARVVAGSLPVPAPAPRRGARPAKPRPRR